MQQRALSPQRTKWIPFSCLPGPQAPASPHNGLCLQSPLYGALVGAQTCVLTWAFVPCSLLSTLHAAPPRCPASPTLSSSCHRQCLKCTSGCPGLTWSRVLCSLQRPRTTTCASQKAEPCWPLCPYPQIPCPAKLHSIGPPASLQVPALAPAEAVSRLARITACQDHRSPVPSPPDLY